MTRHPNNQSLHFYKGGINTVEIINRLMKNREKFQKWLEPFIHRLEKYIQQYKAKYRRNGLLYCFLVISLAGYVFFFSSNAWMPDTTPITESKLGKPVPVSEGITVEPKRWIYSPEQKKMEIEMEILNVSNRPDTQLYYSAFEKPRNKMLDVQVMFQEKGILVLEVSGISRNFHALSLLISSYAPGDFDKPLGKLPFHAIIAQWPKLKSQKKIQPSIYRHLSRQILTF